jgi:hypothetical protein
MEIRKDQVQYALDKARHNYLYPGAELTRLTRSAPIRRAAIVGRGRILGSNV